MKLSINKLNRPAFILIYALSFLIIAFKVFNVPITHDEVPTAVFFGDYSIWEIMMYPDASPNNHILNTLLTKYSILAFGNHQWSIRIPALISFIIYGIAAYRILINVLKIDSVFFIPAALLFVANPFLMDFFGLNRGYGLSVALCTLSASYLITGFSLLKNRHIWFAFFLSILACYANFTLLVFWAATTVMAIYYFLLVHKEKKQSALKPILLLTFFCLLYLALIAVPIYKMQSTDQFQYWTSQGFFKETVVSVVHTASYGSRYIIFRLIETIAYSAVVLILFNLIYSIRFIRKNGSNVTHLSQPILIAALLILFTAGINILQTMFLNTPNLNGRTALFFYPLFILVLVTSLSLLSNLKKKILTNSLAITIAAGCVFHILTTTKLDSVREWAYDANTLKVIDYLDKDRNNKNTSIKTNWLFNPSFYYYKHIGETPWLDLKYYDKNIELNTDAEYYYVLAEDFEILESRFEPVLKFENNCWLLKRKKDSSSIEQ